MSAQYGQPSEGQGNPDAALGSGERGGGAGEPTEEEMRAAYEAELSRITATDMMAQAAVSLLNIGARRLAPPGAAGSTGVAAGAMPRAGAERDLEQTRDAIDAVKALLEILKRRIPQELGPLRDALSRLQMAYAREVPAGAAGASAQRPDGQPAGVEDGPKGAPAQPSAGQQAPQQDGGPAVPGPAESSGRLWVPGR